MLRLSQFALRGTEVFRHGERLEILLLPVPVLRLALLGYLVRLLVFLTRAVPFLLHTPPLRCQACH